MDDKPCAQGATCHFAHTNEEALYHPVTYKTEVCEFDIDPSTGKCVGNGRHCHKVYTIT